MKATGIVRTIDHLGRCVIPKELRRTLHISEGDPLEFFVDEGKLIVRKYDSIGDLEQLLDGVERNIRLMDPIVPAKKLRKLLGEVKTMRRILAED